MTKPLRRIAALIALVFRSDPARALVALAPVIPAAQGLSYLAARHLLRGLSDRNSAAIGVAAALLTGAFAGSVWISRIVRTTRIRLGELAIVEFNLRWVNASLRSPTVDVLEQPEHRDRLAVLQQRYFEIGQVPRMLGWLVDSGGGILVSFLLLIDIDPWLGAVVLAGLPPALVSQRAEALTDRAVLKAAPHHRRASHLYDLGTEPAHAMEVRVAALGPVLLERFDAEWRRADKDLFRSELTAGLAQLAGWVFQAAVFAGGVALTVARVRSGAADAADAFVALAAMGLVVGQFGQAAGGLSNIGRVGRLFDDIAQFERSASPARPKRSEPATALPPRLRDGVRLTGVSFRYGQGAGDALHDVTLHLPAGHVVAIVGENGAGKSTLVDVLFGLRQPTSGTITIDGIKLDDANIDAWRTRTSACFQNYLRLELAARESVGAGDLPRLHDDAAIRRALAQADADALVPDLDMLLGPRLGGTDLSGGEWQRIANARANMRSHPLLLALDEPTSALDPLAERAAFDRYAATARTLSDDAGTITVLVSHRLATVRDADMIVVLDKGSVVEQGSHDELIQAGSGYAELFDLQARHYR